MLAIIDEFGGKAAVAVNTVTIYMAGLGLGQLLYGPISDRLGRKPPLLFGPMTFAAGSILCAAAPNIEIVMLGRLVEAVGAAAATVLSRVITRDLFGRERSASMLGYPNPGGNWDHRRPSAFPIRASAAASTSAPTITRSPPASTISIRPGIFDGAGNADAGSSEVILAGTNVTAVSLACASAAAISHRQVNSVLAFRSCRRATTEIDAPGANASATIRRFSSSDHERRRRPPSPPTASPLSSDANINDRVHYLVVDTIIASH